MFENYEKSENWKVWFFVLWGGLILFFVGVWVGRVWQNELLKPEIVLVNDLNKCWRDER